MWQILLFICWNLCQGLWALLCGIYLVCFLTRHFDLQYISLASTLQLSCRLINWLAVAVWPPYQRATLKRPLMDCSAISNYKVVAFVFMGETARRDFSSLLFFFFLASAYTNSRQSCLVESHCSSCFLIFLLCGLPTVFFQTVGLA